MAADFIPEKFYVARQTRNHNTPDEILGFMQPMHKEGFAGRKDTADRWASRNALEPMEIENVPMSGFSLTENKRRMMNKNVIWRVLHPMGFEFEITSDNFSDFLMEIDMKGGIIQTPMMFVRRHGENYLTYPGSEVHKEAVPQSAIETRVSLKDIKPGDHVRMKDGNEVVYQGAIHVLIDPTQDGHYTPASKKNAPTSVNAIRAVDPTKVKSVRKHFYCMIYDGKVQKSMEHASSFAAIELVKPGDGTKSNQDIVDYYNSQIDDPSRTPMIDYRCVIAASTKPITLSKCKVELRELPMNQVTVTCPVGSSKEYYDRTDIFVKHVDSDNLYAYSFNQPQTWGSSVVGNYIFNDTQAAEVKDSTYLYRKLIGSNTRYYSRVSWEASRHKLTENPAEIHKMFLQRVIV